MKKIFQELKNHLADGNNYFGILFVPKLFGTGLKQTIYVSEKAFQKLGVEDYFLSALTNHEGFHATDFQNGMNFNNGLFLNYQNIEQIQNITFILAREIRANKNEMRKLREKNLSENSYFAFLDLNLSFLLDGLREVVPKNDLESKLIIDLFTTNP